MAAAIAAPKYAGRTTDVDGTGDARIDEQRLNVTGTEPVAFWLPGSSAVNASVQAGVCAGMDGSGRASIDGQHTHPSVAEAGARRGPATAAVHTPEDDAVKCRDERGWCGRID